jgi:branched-chain amino acid transport system ATP-binding protein
LVDLLRLEGLSAGYGESMVLEDISLDLAAGGSLALLGRNGMGKSTLLATLMGATTHHGGRIFFDSRNISAWPSHRRARAGIGWVPQERDVFPSLSVEENLIVVAQPGPWDLQRVYSLFPRLAERRRNMGNALSGGEQQMLSIARALMINPRLLLLDEPLEGLAPLMVEELLGAITAMMIEGGMAFILVEQHAARILPLTQQALILERGRVVYASASAVLMREPLLLARWLGVAP